jgi:ribosomal protein S18 acetylase RimI-like enzyme
MSDNLRRLTSADVPRLHRFWSEHWSGDFIVTRGNLHHPEEVEGFVVEDGDFWAGLITFKIRKEECEVISLDGLREGEGIGTILLRQVIEEARNRKCNRIFLITTNDNLYALGFYQRRDFELVAMYRGAVNESRKIKPGIAEIGQNHIPLRDEIELEMIL